MVLICFSLKPSFLQSSYEISPNFEKKVQLCIFRNTIHAWEPYFKNFVEDKEMEKNILEPALNVLDNLPYKACHWQGQTELIEEFCQI